MRIDGHVGIANRTRNSKPVNKCWAIAALQSILAANVLTQRLLDAGGSNSVMGKKQSQNSPLKPPPKVTEVVGQNML